MTSERGRSDGGGREGPLSSAAGWRGVGASARSRRRRSEGQLSFSRRIVRLEAVPRRCVRSEQGTRLVAHGTGLGWSASALADGRAGGARGCCPRRETRSVRAQFSAGIPQSAKKWSEQSPTQTISPPATKPNPSPTSFPSTPPSKAAHHGCKLITTTLRNPSWRFTRLC